MRLTAALVLATLACAGCAGSLLESHNEAPEVYRLSGPAVADRGQRTAHVISIERPRAAASLDSDRIAVRRPGSRFDYDSGVRWAESAPEMLQHLLVRSIAADGRFAAVVAAPSRVPADRLLDSELRRFEAEYPPGDAAPRVRVEIQASLLDVRSTRRITSFVSSAEAEAAENRQAAVLEAFERATAEALQGAVQRLRDSAEEGVR